MTPCNIRNVLFLNTGKIKIHIKYTCIYGLLCFIGGFTSQSHISVIYVTAHNVQAA